MIGGVKFILVALLLMMLAGCFFISESYVSDQPIMEDAFLRGIPDSSVRKQDILRQLGFPTYIATPGEIIDRPKSVESWNRLATAAARLQKPLFYYYTSTSSHKTDVAVMNGIGGEVSDTKKVQRLWILVDQNNKMAVDYVIEE